MASKGENNQGRRPVVASTAKNAPQKKINTAMPDTNRSAATGPMVYNSRSRAQSLSTLVHIGATVNPFTVPVWICPASQAL